MGLITHSVKNLINGVSQQPPSVRLDNQLEEQVNMIPDVTRGLLRRNPVDLLATIAHDASRVYTEEHPTYSFKALDGTELSIGFKPDGTFYQFGKDGTGLTIAQNGLDKAYTSYTDKNDIKFLELENEILVLNKTKVVGTTAVSATSTPRSVAWFDNVLSSVTYSIRLWKNGVNTASPSVKLGSPPDSAAALAYFKTQLELDPNVTCVIKANAIILTYTGVDTYYITTEDDFGLSGLKSFTESRSTNNYRLTSVDDLANLRSLTFGFYVRVDASIDGRGAMYFLSTADGTWIETVSTDYDTLDNLTLPRSISKDTSGSVLGISFKFYEAPRSGDKISNKVPSFVGNKINDMLLYNSRLCFASKNNLTFSEINNTEMFFRNSTASVLQSDRVDISLDVEKLGYADIKNIFINNGKLLVSTGVTQSVLNINSALELTSAVFTKVSSFETGDGNTASAERFSLFPVTKGNYSTVLGIQGDTQGISFSGDVINRQCDRYIKGNINQMIYLNNMLFVRTDFDSQVLYVQNLYEQDGQLVQNAWHRWTLPFHIKHIYSSNNKLRIVCEDMGNAQTVYGELDLVPNTIVDDIYTAGVLTQIGYKPYLDFYTTDHTLLYTWNAGTSTWDANTAGTLSVNSKTSQVVTNPDAVDIVSGIPFDSYLELSEQVPRVSNGQEKSKLAFAKLMLRRIQCTLGLSGRLKVTVGKTHRDDSVFNHIPVVLSGVTIGREAVSDSTLRFAVNADARDTSIKISTVTFTPFNILEYEYQGQLITKGSRF